MISDTFQEEYASGWVHEVFASIQGEGLYCGQRQTFIRLAGCNLTCDYCDTSHSRDTQPTVCRIHTASSKPVMEEMPNPVDTKTIIATCGKLGSEVVALTGGEPLMQPDFLAELMHGLQKRGLSTYLETNGTLFEPLSRVVQYADVIAMDIKLPSAGGADLWKDHERFLEIASYTDVFVKAVVSTETTPDEISRCVELIADVDPRVPLIIQPMNGAASVPGDLLFKMQEMALDRLLDVRVIPQCHKIIGVL